MAQDAANPVPNEDSANAAGFTLVELLVALALFGLLAVMTFGSISFGARIWERGTASSEATIDVQVVQNLLRRQLSSAAAATVSSSGDDPTTLFKGQQDEVTFVAPYPARFAGGGLFRQRIYLDETPGHRGLRLEWQPYEPAAPEGSPFAASGSILLLKDLRDLIIDYYDSDEQAGFAGWRREWTEDRLPAQVRLLVATQEGDRRQWPALVVRLRLGERP